jgi:hypothetical protein
MLINPHEVIAFVHRWLLDPTIVGTTIFLFFVVGFFFGYGVRAYISRRRHRRHWSTW